MENIVCKNCLIPYKKRYLLVHQAKCSGKIEGFIPVYEKKRFMYRCTSCGISIRKNCAMNHQKRCYPDKQARKSLNQLDITASSASIQKNSKPRQKFLADEKINDSQQNIQNRDEQLQIQNGQFQKQILENKQILQFYCPIRKQTILIDQQDLMLQEDQLPKVSKQELFHEKIDANLKKLTQTSLISLDPKLSEFRVSDHVFNPSLTQSIEIYALSCFLRLIGCYTRENKWKQAHGLIKKQKYWEFVARAQPWIVNNQSFAGIAQEKLKYFIHDEDYFIVTNFELVYQRVKGLVENFSINQRKFERIFEIQVHNRKKKICRIKRKNPSTQKLRDKLKRFKSRQKRSRKIHKNPYGIRKLTQLKYQAMKYQVQAIDQAFHMKQVFSKKPSSNHLAQISRKRKKMMINYCMSNIADELTASVILGEFQIWSKSIQTIEPQKRYLYTDQIPNIPSFQFWYPLTMDLLKQRKWYYPYAYQRCGAYFESPLPPLSEEQIFTKLCLWYRSKGLLIDHALYQLQGFDGIRALVDDKYRIQQEKKIQRRKNLSIQINPRVRFAQNDEESESQLSIDEDVIFATDIPARGDPNKWKIVHKAEHLTGFNNCAACQEPLIFPSPSCKICLSAYHYRCRRELQNICLCFIYSDNTRDKMLQMLNEAISEAKKYAKHVDLNIKKPINASIMELKYQEENLGINMETMTHTGLWCLPGSVFYHKSSNLMYLRDKNIALLQKFGKSCVFPGTIEEISGKGRGVIATRQIKKDEIVAIYPGKIVTQAQIIESYKSCKYIFNFQDGPTPFTSWAIVPIGVAHIGMFINHGTPNVIPSRFWSSKGPIILFISLRRIKMGEEILYNYGPEYRGQQNFI